MKFSDLARSFGAPTNELYRLHQERLAEGLPVLDAVSGNLAAAGLGFPAGLLHRCLAGTSDVLLRYDPAPFGHPQARRAISDFYREQGLPVDMGGIVLTPGTSLSYFYLFKLLANPGDEILVPTPGYPLFETIAALCGVRLVPYRLRCADRWRLPVESFDGAFSIHTKAIVLISPHNPTGAVHSTDEIAAVTAWARQRNLPVICDEVFSEFVFNDCPLARAAGDSRALVFTLNGFSKMLALPGFKIGWIIATGPTHDVATALRGLEMISDTFLPVADHSQAAMAALLKESTDFRKGLCQELAHRANSAAAAMKTVDRARIVRPEGGFYLPIELGEADGEKIALALLRDHGVLVHPGHFYDLAENYIVCSYVMPREAFAIVAQALSTVLCRPDRRTSSESA